MSVLMVCSDYSLGISNYTETLYNTVLTDADELVILPRFHLFDQAAVHEHLSRLLETDHDIIHIQYDSMIFRSDNCEYEHLENFIWLLQEINRLDKHAVVTYHGIIQYNNINDLGIIDRYRLKILRKLFTNTLVPLLNKIRVVVHSYYHQEELEKQGITSSYVIPPGISKHSNRATPFNDLEDIKLVIPGQRSGYKKYALAIKMLKKLPEFVTLYISDEETDNYTDAMIAKMEPEEITRVRLASFPRDNIAYLDHLATYDCAILPYDNIVQSSGSLQDCLSVGLPCITSANRENDDIKDQQNCIYSADDISKTGSMYVNRLIYDQSHRDQMVKNVESYYEFRSWSICKDRYINLYDLTVPSFMPALHGPEKINLFMCCRDVEASIEETFSKLTAAEDRLRAATPGWRDTEFHYYILENDSVDNTPGMIADFFESKLGEYSTGTIGAEKWGSHPGAARMRDMASYRNSMKELCTDWGNSRYSFIVDAEIEFDVAIIEKQIKYLQEHTEVAMVTPFGTVDMSNIYYDKFAFRDMQNRNDTLPVITGSSIEAKSAFSGFVCIRTPVLERCRWDVVNGETSEHVPFCNMVNRHGKIIIDSTVVVRW
jgi:hypothetical protein